MKKWSMIAALSGAMLAFGGCGWNLFGDKTFLYTAIFNELLFS